MTDPTDNDPVARGHTDTGPNDTFNATDTGPRDTAAATDTPPAKPPATHTPPAKPPATHTPPAKLPASGLASGSETWAGTARDVGAKTHAESQAEIYAETRAETHAETHAATHAETRAEIHAEVDTEPDVGTGSGVDRRLGAAAGGGSARGRLAGSLGALLRARRQLRNWRQEDLAERAGVSQATVTRIERGERAALPMLERLFAALDLQLRVEVEPLDAHIDARLDELAARPLTERIEELRLTELLDSLDGIPVVFDGPTAALLQGAALPGEIVHVAMAWSDAEAFTAWLVRNHGQRWHERWEEYGFLHLDPRDRGAHRWSTMRGQIAVRMVDALPASIEIRHGDRSLPAVPLPDVEITDPRSAELLQRHRTRRAAALGAAPGSDDASAAAAPPSGSADRAGAASGRARSAA